MNWQDSLQICEDPHHGVGRPLPLARTRLSCNGVEGGNDIVRCLLNKDLLDGREYELLQAAVKAVKGIEGISCEIGVRRGGSSLLIMQQFMFNHDKRLHVGIDPYGNLPYNDYEDFRTRYDYTADMRRQAQVLLHNWCFTNQYDFQLLILEDSEYFQRYADGIPCYDGHKTLMNKYAFVYFDGQHAIAPVRDEIDFFSSRTPKGGVWVFDDLDHYPHMDALDEQIIALGFIHLKVGQAKIAYQRIETP